MKKYFVLTILILTFCSQLIAQNSPYLQPNFQVGGRSYDCIQYGQYMTVVVASTNIIYKGRGDNLENKIIVPFCRIANVKDSVMHNNFRAIFSPQRIQTLLSEAVEAGIFLDRSTGVVKEVYFHVIPNSQVTPLELYQLENQIRSRTYPQTGLETCPDIPVDIVHIGMYVQFKRLQ